MFEYRFFTRTETGAFGNMSVRHFPHDQAAVDFARRLLSRNGAVDIWREHRRVALVEAAAA